jgi:hypothetical protein
MLIDNRSNHPSDLRFARAVTATGMVIIGKPSLSHET